MCWLSFVDVVWIPISSGCVGVSVTIISLVLDFIGTASCLMFLKLHSCFCIKLREEVTSKVKSSFFEGLAHISLLKFHSIVFIFDIFTQLRLCYDWLELKMGGLFE